MDGNGRWAERRGQSRTQGHEAGLKSAQEVYRRCRALGIPHLTLYAFSKENWLRPQEEVTFLFGLVSRYFSHKAVQELMNLDIRLHVFGELQGLPLEARRILEENIQRTANNSTMQLNLALNYSARDEILRAVRSLIADGVAPESVNEKIFAQRLYTNGQPDPDLIIRTSGEYRLSNYLLYQAAYTELYFTDTLWPDFDAAQLDQALAEYDRRQRRFGRTGKQLTSS